MPDAWPDLEIGARYRFQLAGGSAVEGALRGLEGDWARLEHARGTVWIARLQIATIGPPRSGTGAGSGTGGGATEWSESSLRRAAEGFLDGEADSAIAADLDVPRAAVGRLRKAFECARGNLVEDQIPAASAELVPRLRTVLGG